MGDGMRAAACVGCRDDDGAREGEETVEQEERDVNGHLRGVAPLREGCGRTW